MNKEAFISLIAPYIVREARALGYKFPSAIIAQACLESNYGASKLSSLYYNYFGLKCGSSWKGKSVNMKTNEEYSVGTLTAIRDNFRVYDGMADGIDGYFDFIHTNRYANLLQATSSKDYLERIKADGYATSSTYVSSVYAIVTQYDLQKYDEQEQIDTELDNAITVIAKAVIKGKYGNGHETRSFAIYESIRKRVNELC